MIRTFADCPDRVDDEYMEGPGEFYCNIWPDHSKNEGDRNIGATFSCNFNCENGRASVLPPRVVLLGRDT